MPEFGIKAFFSALFKRKQSCCSLNSKLQPSVSVSHYSPGTEAAAARFTQHAHP